MRFAVDGKDWVAHFDAAQLARGPAPWVRARPADGAATTDETVAMLRALTRHLSDAALAPRWIQVARATGDARPCVTHARITVWLRGGGAVRSPLLALPDAARAWPRDRWSVEDMTVQYGAGAPRGPAAPPRARPRGDPAMLLFFHVQTYAFDFDAWGDDMVLVHTAIALVRRTADALEIVEQGHFSADDVPGALRYFLQLAPRAHTFVSHRALVDWSIIMSQLRAHDMSADAAMHLDACCTSAAAAGRWPAPALLDALCDAIADDERAHASWREDRGADPDLQRVMCVYAALHGRLQFR